MTLWWYTNTFVYYYYYYYYYANYGRVSVCHKSVFYRNCCTDRAGFLARRLSSTYSTLRFKEIRVSPKIRVIPREICPELWTLNILPVQVDRVVSKLVHGRAC